MRSLKRQRGFFLTDWIVNYFDDGWFRIVLKTVFLFITVYAAWMIIPNFWEAHKIHDALVLSMKEGRPDASIKDTTDEVARRLQSTGTKIDVAQALTISGRGADREALISYQKSISLLRIGSSRMGLLFDFEFSNLSPKKAVLMGIQAPI